MWPVCKLLLSCLKLSKCREPFSGSSRTAHARRRASPTSKAGLAGSAPLIMRPINTDQHGRSKNAITAS